MGTNGKGRGAVPSSGVEAETNGEVGGAAPPLASKRGQTEREEGRPLIWYRNRDKRRGKGAAPSSGIEARTNGEGGGLPALKRRQTEREEGLPLPLVSKWGQTEREEGCPYQNRDKWREKGLPLLWH